VRRLEAQAGRALEDSVVRHQRDPEAEGSGCDPSVGVVLALAEGVADVHAVGAKLGVDTYKVVPGVDDLGRIDLGVKLASRASPQFRCSAPYRSSATVWNDRNAGRPTMIGSYRSASGALAIMSAP
jgi:hypothetical protein